MIASSLGQRSAIASRPRIAPRARVVRTMAAADKLVAYVKGDPKTSTLGDCPFCHRVLLTLETKRVPYDSSYVDFADKPQWLVDRFEGKVPVVNKGGFEGEGAFWMNDSDKIVEWLEVNYPEVSMASTPPEAANKFFGAFRGWLMAEPSDEADKKAAFLAALADVDAALAAAKGPLFGGDRLNSTDAALAPKLYHALTALKHWRAFDLYQQQQQFEHVKKYQVALAELPEWKAVDYGTAAIIKGWERHMAK